GESGPPGLAVLSGLLAVFSWVVGMASGLAHGCVRGHPRSGPAESAVVASALGCGIDRAFASGSHNSSGPPPQNWYMLFTSHLPRNSAKMNDSPAADPASHGVQRRGDSAPPQVEVAVATDADYAGDEAGRQQVIRPLHNVSEVRHLFRTNQTPIYFVGATPFNLLGIDRWVRNFSYGTYYDGWDGGHPRVFSPRYKPYVEFDSGESI